MKKLCLLLFFALAAFSCSSTAYGYTYFDNFSTYSPGSTILGEGNTGYDWAMSWQSNGTPTFNCYNDSDDYKAAYAGTAGQEAYRPFQESITGDVSAFTFTIAISGKDSADQDYGGFVAGTMGGTYQGVKIGFKTDAAGTLGLYGFQSGSYKLLADSLGTTTTNTYTVSVSDVNFTAYTYSAQVTGYSKVTGIGFNGGSNVTEFAYAGFNGNSQGKTVYIDSINIQGSAVPEPSTIALFLLGLGGIARGFFNPGKPRLS